MFKWYHKSDLQWLPEKQVILPTGEQVRYVSPSSELKRTADNSWKEKWVARVGEAEAARVSQAAISHGRKVHSEIEAGSKKVSPQLLQWQWDNPLVAQEVLCWIPLKSDGAPLVLLGFADSIVIPEETLEYSVVDFKTSKKPKKLEWMVDYQLQISVYCSMLKHTYPEYPGAADARIVVTSSTTDSFFQEFILSRADIKRNLQLFQRRTGLRPQP